MNFLNPLDALIPKIPFFFPPDFWVWVTSKAWGSDSVGLGGSCQLSPFWGRGGSSRRALSTPPPPGNENPASPVASAPTPNGSKAPEIQGIPPKSGLRMRRFIRNTDLVPGQALLVPYVHPLSTKRSRSPLRACPSPTSALRLRQVECGAHALQLFDSTCGCITEAEFRAAALPALERIAAALRRLHPQVPLMVFARGAPYALPALQAAGYDVVTLDPACDRRGARAALATTAAESGGAPVTVQGNFDPQLLWTGVGSAEAVREEVAQMLTDLGPQRLIANLGSGLMGKEDPELVAVLVDTVRALSAQDVRGGASSDGRAG